MDSRSRCERWGEPAFLDDATASVTGHSLTSWGGTLSAVTRAGAAPVAARQIAYDPVLAETLGGIAIPPERQRAILEALGFAVEDGAPWRVSVPSWRRDMDGPADVVEEVARIHGFDAIPRSDEHTSELQSLMHIPYAVFGLEKKKTQ